MTTRRFVDLICVCRTLLVVLLCGVLTVGAFADGKDAKKSGGESRKSESPKHEAPKQDKPKQDTRAKDDDSRRSSDRQSDRPVVKDDRSRDSGSWGKGDSKDSRSDNRGSSTWTWTNKSRTDNDKSRTYESKGSYRYEPRPKDSYRPSTVGRAKDDDRNNPKYNNYRYDRNPGRYSYPNRSSSRYYHYGYWVFDRHDSSYSRRSAYYHYGYYPYVRTTRVYVTPYIVVEYRDRAYDYSGYYLSRRIGSDIDRALADIRDGWLERRLDLIRDHVDTSRRIAVLLDGKYDYSMDSQDYIEMTSDAIDDVQTISFTWESVRERTDGSYTAFGRHYFRDDDGISRTVYVSYTLYPIGSRYYITEVGSSNSTLR